MDYDCEFYSPFGICCLDGGFCPYGGDPSFCGASGGPDDWSDGPDWI